MLFLFFPRTGYFLISGPHPPRQQTQITRRRTFPFELTRNRLAIIGRSQTPTCDEALVGYLLGTAVWLDRKWLRKNQSLRGAVRPVAGCGTPTHRQGGAVHRLTARGAFRRAAVPRLTARGAPANGGVVSAVQTFNVHVKYTDKGIPCKWVHSNPCDQL